MTAALIILVTVIVAGALLYLHHRLTTDAGEEMPPVETVVPNHGELCCGKHAVCEKTDAELAGKIVYFDDEELDRFAGRGAGEYSDAEVEEFREVLLTLIPADIAPWGRSLDARGITLPPAVRDELLLLLEDM